MHESHFIGVVRIAHVVHDDVVMKRKKKLTKEELLKVKQENQLH